ncbi:hypothetical protein B0H13DRAFT_106055 [Mycena leptocephala]|nr:hypothetical protein B0H13DRAFT_106055 [Mycena leptocephala]
MCTDRDCPDQILQEPPFWTSPSSEPPALRGDSESEQNEARSNGEKEHTFSNSRARTATAREAWRALDVHRYIGSFWTSSAARLREPEQQEARSNGEGEYTFHSNCGGSAGRWCVLQTQIRHTHHPLHITTRAHTIQHAERLSARQHGACARARGVWQQFRIPQQILTSTSRGGATTSTCACLSCVHV